MTDAISLLEYSQNGPVTIGTVVNTNVLDGSNVDAFGREAMTYAKAHSGLNILLNFENIRFISSAALTELLRLYHFLNDSKGSVQLCNLNQDIQNVFRITNLEKLFFIHCEEATDISAERFIQDLEAVKGNNIGTIPDSSC